MEAGPVLIYGDFRIAGQKELLGYFFSLVFPYFEEEPAFGGEEEGGLEDEFGEELHAVVSAVEGEHRLKAYFALEVLEFLSAEVGGVRDNHIQRGTGGEWGEEVALAPVEVGWGAQVVGIFLCEAEGPGANVRGPYVCFRAFQGEGEGDAAAACADVRDAVFLAFGQFFQGEVNEQFCFEARDEGPGVHEEGARIKLFGADEVLRRLPFAAALNQRAIGAQLLRLQWALILQIKCNTAALKHMSQQKLRAQPWGVNSKFLEFLGSPAEDGGDVPQRGGVCRGTHGAEGLKEAGEALCLRASAWK